MAFFSEKNKFRAGHFTDYQHIQGFTLMELMIVIAIIAIMMAVASPSLNSVLSQNAQIGSVNSIVSGLSAARTHAVTRKRPYVIEAIDGDWANGYHLKPDDEDQDPEVSNNFDADTNTSITTDAGDFIIFDRLGRANPANSEFVICNDNTKKGIVITVNVYGNAEIDKVDDTEAYNYRDGC